LRDYTSANERVRFLDELGYVHSKHAQEPNGPDCQRAVRKELDLLGNDKDQVFALIQGFAHDNQYKFGLYGASHRHPNGFDSSLSSGQISRDLLFVCIYGGTRLKDFMVQFTTIVGASNA
jgi:hypothetical protein